MKRIESKMETRNISLTLDEAREWYNSNIILRDVALKAFTKEELEFSFKDIKTFPNACEALGLTYAYSSMLSIINQLKTVSRASAAMFKLNIIRKALNLGQDLYFTKNPEGSHIYYPYNPLITDDSTYYEKELKTNKIKIIGNIKNENISYKVLSSTCDCYNNGLGNFIYGKSVGIADFNYAFLGCATKEIAEHFSKYFGMLITEAKYGDLPGFKIINSVNDLI